MAVKVQAPWRRERNGDYVNDGLPGYTVRMNRGQFRVYLRGEMVVAGGSLTSRIREAEKHHAETANAAGSEAT